jgi:predicted RNase H-like HicB family nuclease
MKYAVVIEKGPNNYSAYVPDLPGCVAAADTIEETERLIQGAIEFHIRGMKEDGIEIPPPVVSESADNRVLSQFEFSCWCARCSASRTCISSLGTGPLLFKKL